LAQAIFGSSFFGFTFVGFQSLCRYSTSSI